MEAGPPVAAATRSPASAAAARGERLLERRARGVAADGEDDALQARAGVEVAADLLDLDLGGLVEREAADARAEGDEGQRAGAELVGLPQRRARSRGG